MGTNSATMAGRVVDNTFDVMAIEVLAVVHAIDYLKIADRMAPATKAVFEDLKSLIPLEVEDFSRSKVLANIKSRLKNLADDVDHLL